MDLLAQRAALISEHQAQERHDPHWKAEAKAGDKLSERVVAIQVDSDVSFVGPDVPKVLATLKAFLAKLDKSKEWQERAKREPVVALCVAKARKLVADNPKEICVHSQTYNALGFALDEEGLVRVLDNKPV